MSHLLPKLRSLFRKSLGTPFPPIRSGLGLAFAITVALLLLHLILWFDQHYHFGGGLYRILLSDGLSGVMLLLALLVPALYNPVHSLLALLGLFGAATILFLSQGAEYLAFVFLIVYVGALAILFLFVIMLLNVQEITTNQARELLVAPYLISGLIGISLFLRLLEILEEGFETLLPVTSLWVAPEAEVSATVATDIRLLAGLYKEEAPLFLLVTLILLLAMLGAIVLAVGDQEADSE